MRNSLGQTRTPLRSIYDKRVHYVKPDGTVRCGVKQMGLLPNGEPEVTCRMCLRCIDTDAGLRYTR